MKRFILFFFLLLCSISFAQCPIKLEELLNSKKLTLSEFDTFLLKNNYSYDSNNSCYTCDDKVNNDPGHSYNIISREIKENITFITYSFLDKNEYILNKSLLDDNFELIKTEDNNDVLKFIYKTKNNNIVMIMTKTHVINNKKLNAYFIVFN